ncbi:hypothetical protein AMAG_06269 [Allomyces macrogynus ATCC 38327]|uniref:HSF-type DNA-binding domain-containing protein n=1 Tax=Allomyces macrogynus (strain ATCC 38327) TaxID=578462 RepID=A0A0L0SG03_ALLM3|nr:hypothetical protein AMAG_06269 [Allomyces macrogynus ATCC 38327]|eukprot:KNE61443.1 hypothetical protein AMAG_06269 [Allomyces macrogynus ATCC 38327]
MVSGHSTFVQKMYSILENGELKDIVSWSASGDSFLVHSPGEFARSVLPRYFKHSNFSSYNRQLNMWGFSKISNLASSPVSTVNSTNSRNGTTEYIEPAWEFRHPFFQRGQVHLLVQIKRKSPKPARSPSPGTTDPETVTQLEARVADLESTIADMHSAADQNRATLKRMAQWVLAGGALPAAVIDEARMILRDLGDPLPEVMVERVHAPLPSPSALLARHADGVAIHQIASPIAPLPPISPARPHVSTTAVRTMSPTALSPLSTASTTQIPALPSYSHSCPVHGPAATLPPLRPTATHRHPVTSTPKKAITWSVDAAWPASVPNDVEVDVVWV